jgi:hypothetical protein
MNSFDSTMTERTQDRGSALDSLPVVMAARRALAGAETAEEAVSGVLDRVGDSLAWRVGAFWVAEADGSLRACCTWRARVHRAAEFERRTREIVLAAGEGLPGRAMGGAEPVCESDVTADARYPRHDVAASEGLRAAVAFPVDGARGRHGVIEFFSDEVRIRTGPLLPAFALIGRELGEFLDRNPLVLSPKS